MTTDEWPKVATYLSTYGDYHRAAATLIYALHEVQPPVGVGFNCIAFAGTWDLADGLIERDSYLPEPCSAARLVKCYETLAKTWPADEQTSEECKEADKPEDGKEGDKTKPKPKDGKEPDKPKPKNG